MKASLFLFMLCIIFALYSCDKDKDETPTKCDCPIVEDSFWVRTNGPYGVYVYDIKINSNDEIFAKAGKDGIFRSIDNGSSWQNVNNGLPIENTLYSFGNLYISENNDIYYTSQYIYYDKITTVLTKISYLYKSIDHGNNWTVIKSDSNYTIFLLGVNNNTIFLENSDSTIYMSHTINLKISYDGGVSWITKQNVDYGNIYSSYVGKSGKIILSNKNETPGKILYKLVLSTDNGNNWTIIEPAFLDYSYPASLDNSGNIFCLGGSGLIRRSKDNGNSWDLLTNGLYPLQSQLSNNSSWEIDKKGNIYLSSYEMPDYVIYKSSDNGDSWKFFRKTRFQISDMEFDSKGYMYVLASPSAIYRSLKPVY